MNSRSIKSPRLKERLKRKFIKWLGYDVEHMNDQLLDAAHHITSVTENNKKLISEVERLQSENADMKEHPIFKFIFEFNHQKYGQDPREKMRADERRAYCARWAGMSKEIKEVIRYIASGIIEENTRQLFDPAHFGSEAEQRAFAVGNLNYSDLLEAHVDDIFNEHVGNVETAKTMTQPEEGNSLVESPVGEGRDTPDDVESGGLEIFSGVNSINTR